MIERVKEIDKSFAYKAFNLNIIAPWEIGWELDHKPNNIDLHNGLGISKTFHYWNMCNEYWDFVSPIWPPPIEDYSHNMNLVGTLKKSMCHTINDPHWSRGGKTIN
jgi:hypothetical protein